MDRVEFRWVVTLNCEDGQVVERKVSAFWDPEQEGTSEAIGLAGAAEAFMASGKKQRFAPIAVARA